MSYLAKLSEELVIPKTFNFSALDLFAGCGGLSLGFESSGILTTGYEMESDYVATYSKNLAGDCFCTKLDTTQEYPATDIVIGGPPCQPFSVGGNQLGLEDSRDGFPVFIDAIEKTNPDIWLFENVRGLLYKNKYYFEEIVAKLKKLNYIVEYKLLNAVNFGVPQNRERLITIGHRGNFQFPEETTYKVTAGEALGEMAFSVSEDSKFLTPSMDKYIAKYEKASKCINPRDLHLNRPARTLTCRNLAGATGDMQRVRLPDGRRRRISIREAARLQSFPDWYDFQGSELSQYNQIGNAVPPIFARALAQSIVSYLTSQERYSNSEVYYRNLPAQPKLFAYS
ncbi:MAG: DNA cytosine methyltransferase [bacterium]|nr:DNA cytosine methyltransferase [bacterium]